MTDRINLLIVEDSEDDAELLLRHLRRGGITPSWERVETRNDLRKALESRGWDIVIADYYLPGFSGMEALAMVKKSSPDTPCIIVSGAAGEETAVEAMVAGADDYIVKGNYARLVPAIKRELRDAEARRARRLAESALRDSERRFRETLENIQLLAVNLDAEGKIVFANDFLLSLTGWRREEILERSWFDLFIPPDARDEIRRVFASYIGGGGNYSHYENEILTKSGERLIISWSNTPLRYTSGKTAGVTGIGKDITARKRAEEELMAAKETAEEAMRLKNKFVALVAHDLKSPFGSMLGLLKLVYKDDTNPVPVKHREMLAHAIKNGERMLRMIDELLNVDRVQKARIRIKQELVDARSVAAMAIENLEALAGGKQVRIINGIPAGHSVTADLGLYKEVLENLISNAIKFSHSGGEVTIFAPEGDGCVAVRDEGVGIHPDVIAKLFKFDEKTTTRGTAGEEGTGLGLPLSYEIMQAHGGTIKVESKENEGTVFYAILPCSISNHQPAAGQAGY